MPSHRRFVRGRRADAGRADAGRASRGGPAENVVAGIRAARAKGGVVTTKVDKILDETAAVRAAIRRAAPGDLVVCCVDALAVYKLANDLLGVPGGASAISDPGELDAPAG